MQRTHTLAALTVLLAAGQASVNANITLITVTNPDVPAGFVANEIVWTGPSDWTSAGIVIDLSIGSVYNHPNGSIAAPIPALFGPFPELEFDTYFGIIDDSTGGIAGGAGDIGGGPLSEDAPQVSVSWFNTSPNDTEPVQIGMLTLSDDSQGTISWVSQGVMTSGTLIGGVLAVPGPGQAYLQSSAPDVIPGYTAHEIFWDGDGENWDQAHFTLDLTQGHVYNDPAGSDTAPTSAQIVGNPDLAFDTYLGIIDDATGSIKTGPDCPGCLPLTGPDLDIRWENTDTTDRGLAKIGNITLSNDAIGSWTLEANGYYITGNIVPEPTSLALLALAAPALLRRR